MTYKAKDGTEYDTGQRLFKADDRDPRACTCGCRDEPMWHDSDCPVYVQFAREVVEAN